MAELCEHINMTISIVNDMPVLDVVCIQLPILSFDCLTILTCHFINYITTIHTVNTHVL